jgi:hypothetical protein
MANKISGQALAGTLLTLSGTVAGTALAGPTGAYSFTGLAAGSYTVTPSKQGISFTPASQSTTIVATDIVLNPFFGSSVGSAGSTYTIQNVVDRVQSFSDIEPVLNVGGFSLEPALTIANDVFTEICATPFPHKWNSAGLPTFCINSWQQDYCLINPDGSSVYQFEWLERGIGVNLSSTQFPKPWVRIECGRSLPSRTGTYAVNGGTQLGDPGFIVASLPNSELYFGTWGASNINSQSWGNNPTSGSFYVSPIGIIVLSASWSGGVGTFALNQLPQNLQIGSTIQIAGATPAGYNGTWTVLSVPGSAVVNPTITVTMASNPGTYQAGGAVNGTGTQLAPNPITQIVDANGNLLMLTTYGAEGTAAPLATMSAPPGTQVSGTGATTVWTVMDPVGMGLRILNVPTQTGVVWQFNIVGQLAPPKFTTLDQVIAPLPDKYEPFFRAGFIAQCYKYSPEAKIAAKFDKMWALWKASLNGLREAQDRELEEYSFTPERTVMGQGRSRNTFRGASWPFPYPVVN